MCGDAGKVGHGSGEAAAEKRCTPTVNSLSDSGVRRAIEAIEGIALRGWRRRRRGWFRCTPQKRAFIALLNEGALALLHFAGFFSLNIALFA